MRRGPDSRTRLVVIGPTPPPVGGQSVMVQAMLDASSRFPQYEMRHVPVRYSRTLANTGRASSYKTLHLVTRILRTIWAAGCQRRVVMYYTPAGPTRTALYRDIVFLIATRWRFSKVVFHFHAGGLGEYIRAQSRPIRALARASHSGPDLAIVVGPSAPDDGGHLDASNVIVVPNGVAPINTRGRRESASNSFRVLFVGLICRSKGVEETIRGSARLASSGYRVTLRCVGEVQDEDLVSLGLELARHSPGFEVTFPGPVVGAEKASEFEQADVLCFPSYFESESFGLVCAEAMSAGLPVVASRWRGIPDVVAHNDTGLLVEVKSESAVYQALKTLVENPELAGELGSRGKQRFHERFTLDQHLDNMAAALSSLERI